MNADEKDVNNEKNHSMIGQNQSVNGSLRCSVSPVCADDDDDDDDEKDDGFTYCSLVLNWNWKRKNRNIKREKKRRTCNMGCIDKSNKRYINSCLLVFY